MSDRFNDVKGFEIEHGVHCAVGPQRYILELSLKGASAKHVLTFDVAEARVFRDWLNKALPA